MRDRYFTVKSKYLAETYLSLIYQGKYNEMIKKFSNLVIKKDKVY